MANKIIKINRGDSYAFDVFVYDGINKYEKYLLTGSDAIYFALLLPHQKFENAVIIKGYTIGDQDVNTGTVNIKISPKDTKFLEPGVYYYTVKLQCGGDITTVGAWTSDENIKIKTLIERTKFIINE